MSPFRPTNTAYIQLSAAKPPCVRPANGCNTCQLLSDRAHESADGRICALEARTPRQPISRPSGERARRSTTQIRARFGVAHRGPPGVRDATRRRVGDSPPRSRSPKATANTKYRPPDKTHYVTTINASDYHAADWVGFDWSPWLSLNPADGELSRLSTNPGIYRVRHFDRDGLTYIGQTGRSLRGRVRALSRCYKEEMPNTDPQRRGTESLGRTAGVRARLPGLCDRTRRRRLRRRRVNLQAALRRATRARADSERPDRCALAGDGSEVKEMSRSTRRNGSQRLGSLPQKLANVSSVVPLRY